VVSYLPMLAKALRTRDLTSYSVSNLVLANLGNGVHSLYVFSLPTGPIWFLHTFYLLSSAVMLVCYRRYSRRKPDILGDVRPETASGPFGPGVPVRAAGG
jgi:hypothetical protein